MQWHQIVKETSVTTDPPTTSLIDLDELKKQVRVVPDDDETDEDTLYTRYSLAAEKIIEGLTELALRPKDLILTFACWPSYCDYCIIPLEIEPVTSLTYIKYYDSADAQQTLASTKYELWSNTHPPQIFIKASNLPTLSFERSKVVEISFSANEDEVVPIEAEQAIVELVAFWFQNRESFGKPMPVDTGAGRVFYHLIDSLKWRAYP